MLEWLDEKGLDYDSVILDEGGTPEGGWRWTAIVPRNPEQIKSATGNQGTFDPKNPDINFMPEDSTAPGAGKSEYDRMIAAGYSPARAAAAQRLADRTEETSQGGARFMAEDDLPEFSAVNILHRPESSLGSWIKKQKNPGVAKMLEEIAMNHWGETITSKTIKPEQEAAIVVNGIEEYMAARSQVGNAETWYTESIKDAMAAAQALHPELNDDNLARTAGFDDAASARIALALAMAITSQNLAVPLNTRFANEQFQILKDTGKFDSKKEYGQKAISISSNLQLANILVEKLGWSGASEFLDRKFTVGELIKTAKKVTGKKVTVEGLVDDVVNGSAMFGPKIGQGFFQNLIGNFNPVTVDLWMRRTWGRWTGNTLGAGLTPARIARFVDEMRDAKIALPDVLKSVRTIEYKGKRWITKETEARLNSEEIENAINESAKEVDKKWQKAYKQLAAGITPEQLDALNNGDTTLMAINKQQQRLINLREAAWDQYKGSDLKATFIKAMRKRQGETAKLTHKQISSNKPEWAKASAVIVNAQKPIDVPSQLDHRTISRIVNKIREGLEARGLKPTNADIQATLWYPEKDIWAKLTGKKESNLKNSYDEEFLKLADAKGVGELARKFIADSRRERPDTTGGSRGGTDADSQSGGRDVGRANEELYKRTDETSKTLKKAAKGRFMPEDERQTPQGRAKARQRARLTPYSPEEDARPEQIDIASLNRNAEAVRVMLQEESGGYDIAAQINGKFEPLAQDVPHDRLADYIGERAKDVPKGTTTKLLTRESGKSFMPENNDTSNTGTQGLPSGFQIYYVPFTGNQYEVTGPGIEGRRTITASSYADAADTVRLGVRERERSNAELPMPSRRYELPEGFGYSMDGSKWTVTPTNQTHGRPYAGTHKTKAEAYAAAMPSINAEREYKQQKQNLRSTKPKIAFKELGLFADPKTLQKISKLWQQVSKNDESFAYGRTTATDPAKIAKDMSKPNAEITGSDNGMGRIKFESKNGVIFIVNSDGDRPKISAPSAGSSGKKEGGGSQLYQAAFAWAHNNGKTIYPSRALSDINAFVRRTSNMLSSALRFGTTDHMIPDDDQKVKNWKLPSENKPATQTNRSDYRNLSIDDQNAAIEAQVDSEIPRRNSYKSDAEEDRVMSARERRFTELNNLIVTDEQPKAKTRAKTNKSQREINASNIAQLALRESEQVMNALPSLDLVDFDFETGKMSYPDGTEITPADLTKMLEQYGKSSTYDKGIGLSTTQRAIITASALRQAESGGLARPDSGRGVRVVDEQGRLLYMPETSPNARQQRSNPRSAARLRIIARTQQERPERELAEAR